MAVPTVEHEPIEQEPTRSHRPAPRGRPRLRWLALAVVAVVVGGVVAWHLADGEPVEATDEPAGPIATTEVVSETLSDTRSFDGTLGHGAPSTVTAPAQGVVTRVAESGTDVHRGTELYRVDERPVIAMYGDIPMYREIGPGDEGVDVAQLIDNLTALGHADCDAVDEVTDCVEAAIADWQVDVGIDEGGVVHPGDVVFLPEGTQVSTVHVEAGTVVGPGTAVLDLTGTDQVVSLDVEVRDQELLSVGTDVAVELPGDTDVAGTVTAAEVVADPETGADAGVDDTVAQVEVTLADPVDESLLGAPADVVIELGERVDVLTVPVNALLALAEGGHGLEVVADDGTTSMVPVETGLFAQGRVEVSGDGIEEGTVVGVAGR